VASIQNERENKTETTLTIPHFKGVFSMPTKKVAKKVVKKKVAKKPAAKKTVKKAVKPKAKTAKKPAKKAAKKPVKKAKPAKKPKAKRKPNPAFMKPMTPSDALAAVVGSHALPRTEVTKKVWEYIKKHGLQDSNNRRMINADDTLKRVFGGKNQVNMFEMTKLVNKHLS
jgi:upstream activation factor subunit UAF30